MSYFQDKSGTLHYLFGKEGAKKLAKKLQVRLLAEIPMDPDIVSASDQGKPLVFYDQMHNVTKIFAKIAEQIANQ
jgi:ATP-binding protein involved in chromosome partitioning